MTAGRARGEDPAEGAATPEEDAPAEGAAAPEGASAEHPHGDARQGEAPQDATRDAEPGDEDRAEGPAKDERDGDRDLEESRRVDSEDEAEEDIHEPRRRSLRRRSAETTTGASRRRAARREPEEAVSVRAQAKYVRCAPRKARLVIEHIRGKSVEDARAILLTTPRAASRDVLKLLDSCVANAENNHELSADELRVDKAYVDEGPTLKRYRPRALGRATRIRKRTSHMTIYLTNREAA
jgi:large subunit ribosomal protein L22